MLMCIDYWDAGQRVPNLERGGKQTKVMKHNRRTAPPPSCRHSLRDASPCCPVLEGIETVRSVGNEALQDRAWIPPASFS
jgi:hypothetical protein